MARETSKPTEFKYIIKSNFMREIKFRAKRVDGLGWVYGYVVKTPITAEFNLKPENGAFFDSGGIGRYCIVTDSGVAHEIVIETIGQYTGLHDKNGKEIYEGDIIGDGECAPEEVRFEEGSWVGRCEAGTDKLYELEYLEVIGNV